MILAVQSIRVVNLRDRKRMLGARDWGGGKIGSYSLHLQSFSITFQDGDVLAIGSITM